MIPAFVACFYAGVVAGWFLRDVGKIRIGADPLDTPATSGRPVGPSFSSGDSRAEATDPAGGDRIRPTPDSANVTTAMKGVEVPVSDRTTDRVAGLGAGVTATAGAATNDGTAVGADLVTELRRRALQLPIDHASIDAMEGSFAERRGRTRGHQAIDILAVRNTPIRAVDDGTIARLFESKAGGLSIYQFDPARRFNYYYAHLERYAKGLQEGQRVSAGDVVGYVGTSGNAPKNTPHLHFAISELGPERRWWQGRPIDPYLVFKK
jgi:peptidoglycan LD-endopeptidase LytH